MEGCYMVMYDPEVAMNSQAFAYKCKDTGKVESLSTWCLLEPVEEEVGLKSDVLELVDYSTKNPTQGRVAYICNRCEDLGVKVGDIVGIGKNRDYVIKIDDKEYYRTRSEDFLYVVEE
jgi:co-chaperonin GroES (HSP10)